VTAPFVVLERVMCHQCPHTERSHNVSGASLMISNSPSSLRQVSQINLSPISLSATHFQRNSRRRMTSCSSATHALQKMTGLLNCPLLLRVRCFSGNFCHFPPTAPKKRPAIGIFRHRKSLSIAPFAWTANRYLEAGQLPSRRMGSMKSEHPTYNSPGI